jgi:putative heme uptake system protein
MITAMTEVILDIENIDATLGFQILEHKPLPSERPDWSLLVPNLKKRLHSPAEISAVAVLKEASGEKAIPQLKFANFLKHIGWRTVFAQTFASRNSIPLSRDLVDDVTAYLLTSSRAGTVLVGGMDKYAAGCLADQKARGARVGVVGFQEFISDSIAPVVGDCFFDLEFDLGLFRQPLPRIRLF